MKALIITIAILVSTNATAGCWTEFTTLADGTPASIMVCDYGGVITGR